MKYKNQNAVVFNVLWFLFFVVLWVLQGSHNDIAESLGYQTFHGILTFELEKIEYIAFKNNTKEPIFVKTKKDNLISYYDIVKAIEDIDWEFERRHTGWNG